MRKTRIICTTGPATSSLEMLSQLAKAGMNVARPNMSHRDHAAVIANIQHINSTQTHPIAILLDTQGPEIRTGTLQQILELIEGNIVYVVACSEGDVARGALQINYDDLVHSVDVGDRITIDNGLINLEVLEKKTTSHAVPHY